MSNTSDVLKNGKMYSSVLKDVLDLLFSWQDVLNGGLMIALGCISLVSSKYYYTPVFLHTLAITFLGPSPSGHPGFGISRPWVWLLGGGGSHGMAAPDVIFCRQGMHIPACPVGCFAAETNPGQASRWGPYSPGSRPNILGCCGGPNRAQTRVKSPSQVPEKKLGDVFTLYFKCICMMYWDVNTSKKDLLVMHA